MGETCLFSSLPVGNTYATIRVRVIRNIWSAGSLPLPTHPNSVTLAARELFVGLDIPQIVDSWVCGGKWRTAQAYKAHVRGTLTEKGNVLSEAAAGPHCPTWSDVNPDSAPLSKRPVLRFSFTLSPHPQQGEGHLAVWGEPKEGNVCLCAGNHYTLRGSTLRFTNVELAHINFLWTWCVPI